MGIGRWVPRNWVALEPNPFGRGVPDPYKNADPHVGCHDNFDRCQSNGTSAGMEIRWKTGLLESCLSGSFKVIATDTDRSGTCDFLLTFHSNHEPILYIFKDMVIGRKARIFLNQLVFNTFRRVPVGTGQRRLGCKSQEDDATRQEKNSDIFSHFDIIHECDRRTDRRRVDNGRWLVTRLRIASRGNKTKFTSPNKGAVINDIWGYQMSLKWLRKSAIIIVRQCLLTFLQCRTYT